MSKNTPPNNVDCGRVSVLLCRRCDMLIRPMYFLGFVDDNMFSDNEPMCVLIRGYYARLFRTWSSWTVGPYSTSTRVILPALSAWLVQS